MPIRRRQFAQNQVAGAETSGLAVPVAPENKLIFVPSAFVLSAFHF